MGSASAATSKKKGDEQLPFSFSLTANADSSAADFVASNATQFAEWTDGFNMLFNRNFGNKETADLIVTLTDIERKVRMQDAMANRQLEIPDEDPAVPPFPDNLQFHFTAPDMFGNFKPAASASAS